MATRGFQSAGAAVGLTMAALGICGCGGGDDSTSSATNTSTNRSGPPIENTTGGIPPTTASLAADPGGALAYDTTELTMAAGQPTIQFTNKSGTDHDVTIEDANGNVIGQSKVIANGSTEVRFIAESDTYTFYCSVDGHREAGMEGTLTLVNP